MIKANGDLCYTLINGSEQAQTTILAKLDVRSNRYRRLLLFPLGKTVHIFYAYAHQAIPDLWRIEHRLWNGKSWRSVNLGEVQQGDLLASAYAAAKVHALPSWFETPGLSSLEAGAYGTRILSTNQGTADEYFLDMAAYVQPLADDSLCSGLKKAWAMSPLPLAEHIREHYPWSKVAAMTLAAYQTI
jgi:glycosyltransferase involved in cell wall biosynthesis